MKKIFVYYLRPFYLRMAWGFVIKFAGTLMDLFLPWALAYMIDTVIPANGRREILLWGIFMLLCSLLAVTFSVVANRMASRVAGDAIYVIRQDLFAKVMILSDRQTDELTRPSLISRLTADTYNVHQMLGRIQRLGVRAPILLIGGIVMTLMLDRVLAGVLLATLPLLTLVVVIVSKRSIPLYGRLQESLDEFVRLVREDIAGIRVIKALSREDYERRRFKEINRQVVEREKKAAMTASATSPAMNILLNLGLVAVIVVGALRVNAGVSEVGKILAFMTYFTIILNAMMSISKMFVIISKAVASANRIAQVMDVPEDLLLQVCERLAEDSAYICFDHVTFSYNKTEPNLEDISFSLQKGETLGIIGATGAGKSTIAALLMRFYDTDHGNIYIDGENIRAIPIETLRQKFGVVFQNDTIFEESIAENVRMGRTLSEEAVQEAVVHAKAQEFVEEEGRGYENLIYIRGANLSGGQKQRILIARALAAKPDILVLDDASSALDYKTDAALRHELTQYFTDSTKIIIAQRISSIMHADAVMVLEEGRIIGYGTHETLLKTCAVYREIRESQMQEM